ncbi:MAG: hypothetical protein MHPSP_000228 [Paramarteilia canceri]
MSEAQTKEAPAVAADEEPLKKLRRLAEEADAVAVMKMAKVLSNDSVTELLLLIEKKDVSAKFDEQVARCRSILTEMELLSNIIFDAEKQRIYTSHAHLADKSPNSVFNAHLKQQENLSRLKAAISSVADSL